MGVISVTIAEGNFSDEWSLCTSRIPRTNSRIDVGDVTKHVGIPLVMHNKKSRSGLSSLLLKDIRSLSSPTLIPPAVNLNLLWHMYGMLVKPEHRRPSWSGFMQTVCVGVHAPVAELTFLPIIDLKPTDKSCVLSTLLYMGMVKAHCSTVLQRTVDCHVLSMIFRTRKLPKSRLVKQDCNCSIRQSVLSQTCGILPFGVKILGKASTRKVTTD